MTIVATPGASNANSYLTEAEADLYHDSNPYTSADAPTGVADATWEDATSAQKEDALVTATAMMDEMYHWYGFAASTTQALQWPRNNLIDFLKLSIIDSSTIPQRLKNATAELAYQLLKANRTLDYAVDTKGISSLKAGPVSITFKDTVRSSLLSTIPDAVRRQIPGWWGRLRGRSLNVPTGVA